MNTCCKDPDNCWEPCGNLGNDENFAIMAPPGVSKAELLKSIREGLVQGMFEDTENIVPMMEPKNSCGNCATCKCVK